MSFRDDLNRVREYGLSEANKRIDWALRSEANRLDLARLALSTVPDGIGQLTDLTRLWLTKNYLSVLSPEIGELINLKTLWLDGNNLTNLPPEIGQLTNLTSLWLDGNNLTNLPPEIGQLTNLTSLWLDGNNLTVLPPEIGQLTNLTKLDLSRHDLSTLPPEIGQLTNLTKLWLDGNNLTELPPEIGQLTNLTELRLGGNKLTELPPEIGQLTNLTELRLGGNKLTELPPEVGQLTNLTELQLQPNPWTVAVSEILQRQGTSGLLSYLRRLSTPSGTARAGQAKILVVGEGGVGKTSLVAQLCGRGFVNKPSTHGIEIATHTEVASDGAEYLLRFWDFGGQELYRITHQFFFTPNTLYIIVWHAREGADRGEIPEWVERIRLRLGDEEQARILLVATHCKTQNAMVDYASLQQLAGPAIPISVEPIQVDNSDGTGVDELRAEIMSAIRELGVADTEWPDVYTLLSKRLAESQSPAISWSEFLAIGKDLDLSPSDCETAAIQFAVAGRLTYFKDSGLLSGRVILQPDWLTVAISYLLRDREIVSSEGIVSQQRLFELWTDPMLNEDGTTAPVTFKRDDVPFLIELMHQYGVGFRLPAPNDSDLLISQRVPQQRPADLGKPTAPDLTTRRIRVELGTNSTRASLIPGLTSRAHQYAVGGHWWQSGVVFEDPTQRAWAIAELTPNRPELTLTVIGPRPEAFFSHLRRAVETRLAEWPGLSPTYKVLCPTSKPNNSLCSGSWLHSDLITKHELGVVTEVCTTCKTTAIPIAELLGYLPTSTVGGSGGVIGQRTDALAERFGQDDVDDLAEILRSLSDSQEQLLEGQSQLSRTVRSQAALTRADTYAQTVAVFDFLGQEIVDTPRLVSIHPSGDDNTKFNPRTWHTERLNLRLWCEYPSEEHPVDGVHSFTCSREWYSKAAPYLKWAALTLRILPVARNALALGETLIDSPDADELPPIPPGPDGNAFNSDELKVIRQGVQLTEAVAAAAIGGSSADTKHRDGIVDARSDYNHPSLRQIRVLLHDIGVMEDGVLCNSELRRTPPSPTAAWGTATSITTDGRPIWVCHHHWRHFTSQR